MYEIPSEKPRLRSGVPIAVAILVCLVGFPLVYFAGSSSGYMTGKTAGYDLGYNSGYDDGYELGYSRGHSIGDSEGYNEGYSEGRQAGRFDFYYVKPKQKYGVDELADWLGRWEWLKPYQAGVFDCSEMSAYTEWKLENEGWHTLIIVGNCPFATGKHAWLLVETSTGKYMPVESTDISVVMWADPNFDKYFEYDHQFETIQQALAYNQSEFDWWA
jgi:hypothetical protein